MKNRKGICIDCPEGSEEKFLISKRCEAHYWKHRKEINSNKIKVKKQKKEVLLSCVLCVLSVFVFCVKKKVVCVLSFLCYYFVWEKKKNSFIFFATWL